MAKPERQQAVLDLLKGLRGIEPLKELFWSELNYQRVNEPLSRRGWTDSAAHALADDPVLFASGGENNDFHVIYGRLASDRLMLGNERPVVSRLVKEHPYALFVFSNKAQDRWHFLNVKYDDTAEKRRLFRRITVGPEERLRTASERLSLLSLDTISPELLGIAPLTIQQHHDQAFDVEAVTKEFFTRYREIFEDIETKIRGLNGAEARRLYTQRLFNRLMFVAFIQKKGWLKFDDDADYLDALWNGYQRGKDADANFYRDRVKALFFRGLNNAGSVNQMAINRGGLLGKLIGQVPYLNGGLFEEDEEDKDAGIVIPDACLDDILNNLFARFNFTVTESTPLDVEVAVDPEMLGKVFEELVTGRHESGSYYTPKPVVSFKCREALIVYLTSNLPHESADAIVRFVEHHDPTGLRNPEAVLDALKRVKVCDLACGSGAYLVGMLHELLDLRACLFVAKNLDPISAYQRKLEIIQNNLYGVDLDPFAVNIARLRLWLSLAVEFEGDDPPPLPNLDFKIEVGDSLSAPNPETIGQQAFRDKLLGEFREAKSRYMTTSQRGPKQELLKQINTLRHDIAEWTHSGQRVTGFDWAVEFAEVFADGGFDIILANPPYVRMELIKPLKPVLRAVYPHVHDERTDLYVYFFARAQQLLKSGGVGCFISSNKWLRAGYGEKLRQHLLDAQAFHLVVDFGDLPVFQAATAYPSIFLWQKLTRGKTATTWAVVKDLQACYDEGVREHVARIAHIVPASQFGAGKPRLASATTADRRGKMEASGPRLGDLVKGKICRGVVTGLNKAFVIDQATSDRLHDEEPRINEIVRPLVTGEDARKYEIHFRETYLLYLSHGVKIGRYPAVERHLKQFRQKLESRATEQEWYELQQPQMAYVSFFDRPKIVYPIISKEVRFSIDSDGRYINDKAFLIPAADWYLVGVLNSDSVQRWVVETLSPLRGGYYEFRAVYMETIPIPDATAAERELVAGLAREAQRLHGARRKRVEKFLRDLGTSPAESSSRNPLEQPWALTSDEFTRRARQASLKVFTAARDETAALTEEIQKVEKELDARVTALYGL